MNRATLSTCLPQTVRYDLAGSLRVTVSIEKNPYQLPIDSLFGMAARINRKRAFLFVSKILGKHVPVEPVVPLLGGAALAAGYLETFYGRASENTASIIRGLVAAENKGEIYQSVLDQPLSLPERTLFVGLAETATALGYSVFNCFAANAYYVQTTRVQVHELESVMKFREEHSHAVDHRCYARELSFWASDCPVVFIDDELTTGRTILNFIHEVYAKYSHRKYTVLAFLDWRSQQDRELFQATERELGIQIKTFSLLSGTVTMEGQPPAGNLPLTGPQIRISPAQQAVVRRIVLGEEAGRLLYFKSVDRSGALNSAPYLYAGGRFGIMSRERLAVEDVAGRIAERLNGVRCGEKVLCLGTGEFMYLPMRVASFMGEGVVYHSTTRSPILTSTQEDYIVQNGYSFPDPDDATVQNYVYNVPAGYYDELFFFSERDLPEEKHKPLLEVLSSLGIPRVYWVICGPEVMSTGEQPMSTEEQPI